MAAAPESDGAAAQQLAAQTSTSVLQASDTTATFACPAHSVFALTDFTALNYLSEFLREIQTVNRESSFGDSGIPQNDPALKPSFDKGSYVVTPLRTLGNGNCLPNALSLALHGHEQLATLLKQCMYEELVQNREWYRNKLEVAHPGAGDTELELAIEQVGSGGVAPAQAAAKKDGETDGDDAMGTSGDGGNDGAGGGGGSGGNSQLFRRMELEYLL